MFDSNIIQNTKDSIITNLRFIRFSCAFMMLVFAFSCSGTIDKPIDPITYVNPFICTEGDNG